MTTVVDEAKAIELLERAVEEKGSDYVDPRSSTTGCEYADEKGQPLCIVGHVLSYLGVDLRPVVFESAYGGPEERLWGDDFSAAELYGSSEKAPLGDIEFTSEATYVLSEAQNYQDSGKSWGEALGAAQGAA